MGFRAVGVGVGGNIWPGNPGIPEHTLGTLHLGNTSRGKNEYRSERNHCKHTFQL